jgi:hypothetical protein
VPLRPLSLGEIYDGAFQAMRTNPRTMIGISAIVLAVTVALTTLPQAVFLAGLADSPLLDPTGSTAPTARELADFIGEAIRSSLVPYVVQFLALTVLNALLVVAVSGAVLGERMAPGLLWSRVRHRLLSVIGLALVTAMAFVLIGGLLLAPGAIAGYYGSTAAAVLLVLLGLLAFVVIGVLLYTRWSLAGPALLLEEQGVFAALRRSWRLVRGSSWRILGILVLTQILVGIGSGLVSVPFTLLGTFSTLGQSHPYASFGRTVVQLLVTGVGSIVAGAVFYPFAAAVTALLYVDVRMRREGLDVELMRAAESGPAR